MKLKIIYARCCAPLILAGMISGVCQAQSGPVSFAFDTISQTQYVSQPFPIRVVALKSDGISTEDSFVGNTKLQAMRTAGGAVVSCAPDTIGPFVAGVYSGSVTINETVNSIVLKAVLEPGITVTQASGNTSEDGQQAVFSVVMDSQPTADVVVGLYINRVAEAKVLPRILTFTQSSWSQPQTVTITGLDDDMVDGDRNFVVITAAAISDDPLYHGINPDDVAGVNLDNDVDTTAPTASIAFSFRDGIASSDDQIAAVIVTSEDVTGLDLTDIVMTGATPKVWRQISPHQYHLTLRAGSAPGFISIRIPQGSCLDLAGNPLAHAARARASIAYAPWGDNSRRYRGIVKTNLLYEDAQGAKADIELQWIKPGTFFMGSAATETHADTDETRHRVTISHGFWMSRFEITQRQWRILMGSNPATFIGQGSNDEETLPIENVSWYDIVGAHGVAGISDRDGFLEKLNMKFPGLDAALPTEAQWEYGCRAETTTTFFLHADDMVGDANSYAANKAGWFAGNSADWNYKKSQEVAPSPLFDITNLYQDYYLSGSDYTQSGIHHNKQKSNSNWFLKDMCGNVQEWCADWYVADLGTAHLTDPAGPTNGTLKIVRGGSWRDPADKLRSAGRDGLGPDSNLNTTGFRIVIPGDSNVSLP